MTIFPTTYFGNLNYYQALLQVPDLFIEIKETFPKQTYRNRLDILTANGPQSLTIPVLKPNGNRTRTEEVEVSPEKNWRKDHWKAMESAYALSPYFEHYEPEVKALIFSDTNLLIDFNQQTLLAISKWLQLPIETVFTTDYFPTTDHAKDFRIVLGDKKQSAQPISTYTQVFSDKYGFVPNLSVLDALFNLGPMARKLFL